jgi:hypothetical protein
MTSAADILASLTQATSINKTGNLQAGVAATQPSVPQINVPDVKKDKTVTPKETLASFTKPQVASALILNNAATSQVDTRLRALQAFSQSGSLSEAASSFDISE